MKETPEGSQERARGSKLGANWGVRMKLIQGLLWSACRCLLLMHWTREIPLILVGRPSDTLYLREADKNVSDHSGG